MLLRWVKVFKNGPCLSRPCNFRFFKGCLRKFYLIHSWILWPKWANVISRNCECSLERNTQLNQNLPKHWKVHNEKLLFPSSPPKNISKISEYRKISKISPFSSWLVFEIFLNKQKRSRKLLKILLLFEMNLNFLSKQRKN